MIIVVGGEKGGTGKTTLATNLAVLRSKVVGEGEVLFMDTDDTPAGSFWCSHREEHEISPRITSVQKRGKAVKTEALALSAKYQDVIIDAGGGDSAELRGGLLAADIAIFPLRPSQFDLWTLGRLSNLVEKIQGVNEKLVPYVLINQASTNVKVRMTEMDDARAIVEEFETFNFLDHVIHERIAFRKAVIHGQSVTEYKPEDPKAIKEIKELYKIIYGGKAKASKKGTRKKKSLHPA